MKIKIGDTFGNGDDEWLVIGIDYERNRLQWKPIIIDGLPYTGHNSGWDDITEILKYNKFTSRTKWTISYSKN